MSYYRPSFSQTVAMSRGSGRGYSPRGSSSYRGSSRGGGYERGAGRGSFSSSRGGRFSSSWGGPTSTNSFDSRSRYSSSGAAGERYSSSSRGRNDEPSYRRSTYRSDGPNNSYTSSRDGNTRSPDRKRMRAEAPSSRRSHGHDGGYGGGDSYGGSGNAGRYESSGTHGHAPSHGSYSERRSFAEERRTAFRPRDEYRKPGPPPSASATRSPRGSYRGGRLSIRGPRGSRIALRDALVRRRNLDSSTPSYLRKRGTAMRPTSDYLRRLRISRIRSAATRRTIKKSKSSEKDESEKEEENWDEELAEAEKKKEEESVKDEDDKEKRSSPAKKSPKKEKDKEESDKEDKKSGSDDEERPRSKYTGRPFIRLTCIHCAMKCVTFREYSVHLFSGRHITAMRKIALRQKAVLARMRQQQRNAQRELEKSDDTLGPRTIFCPLCKLNYRQLKSKHQMSEAHRNMKKFLMPYCRVCHITFKSPMLYENHMCSLEHIKRKAQTEVVNGDKHGSEKDPESPAEEDLENFTTLDSVGDVDEEDEEGNKIAKSPTGEGDSADKSKPKEINVGVEHVKKVEVYYCDLCHIYLSRHEVDEERSLKQHCRGRLHLQRYVRYKEDKDLRRQAERIHRKSQEAKEAKEKEEKEKDKVKVKTEKTEETKDGEEEEKPQTNAATEEDAVDDKMWADVDKDLGEILAEVNTETGNKSDDDEDEDSRPDGERYDRFRLSEKGVDGKEKKVKVEVVEKETEEKEEHAEGEKNEEDKEKSDDK